MDFVFPSLFFRPFEHDAFCILTTCTHLPTFPIIWDRWVPFFFLNISFRFGVWIFFFPWEGSYGDSTRSLFDGYLYIHKRGWVNDLLYCPINSPENISVVSTLTI